MECGACNKKMRSNTHVNKSLYLLSAADVLVAEFPIVLLENA